MSNIYYDNVKGNLSFLYDDAADTISNAAQNALETFGIIDKQILDNDASRAAFQQTYAEAKGTLGAFLDETGARLKQITDPQQLSEWKQNLSEVPGFTRAQYGALLGAGTIGLKRALEGKDLKEVTNGLITGAVLGGAGGYFLPKILDAVISAQGAKVARLKDMNRKRINIKKAEEEGKEKEAPQAVPAAGLPQLASVPATAAEPFSFGVMDPELASHHSYNYIYSPTNYERAYRQYYQRRSQYPAILDAMKSQAGRGGDARTALLLGILNFIANNFPQLYEAALNFFGLSGQEKAGSYMKQIPPIPPHLYMHLGHIKQANPPAIVATLSAIGRVIATITTLLGLVGTGYMVGAAGSSAKDARIEQLEKEIAELKTKQAPVSINLSSLGAPDAVTKALGSLTKQVGGALPYAAIGSGIGGLYGWYNYLRRKRKEKGSGIPAPGSSLQDVSYGAIGGALAGGGLSLLYNALKEFADMSYNSMISAVAGK